MNRKHTHKHVLFGADTDTLRLMLSRHSNLGKKSVLLTDENVMDKLWPLVREMLPELQPEKVFVLKPGEKEKTLDTAREIWSALLEDDFHRHDLLVNLGGGVVTDLGGFVASNFKRGMNCWHIPTSLVGMIDAAVGGKNAVNFRGVKNQIGNFYAPECIYLQNHFLETLPTEELLYGYAEWIKHLLIADPKAWMEWHENGDPTTIPSEDELRDNLQIKLDLVSRDPFDLNERKALNFGHSLGHAMEGLAASRGEGLSHGPAVAYGMMLESWISVAVCGFKRPDFESIRNKLESSFGAVPRDYRWVSHLRPFLEKDKKNDEEDSVSFSLLSAVGQPEVNCKLSYDELERLLSDYPY